MADGPDSLPPYLKHLVVLQFSGLSTDESFAIEEERPPSIIVDNEVPITTDMDCGLRKEGRREGEEGRKERGEGRRGKGRRGKGRGEKGRGERGKGRRKQRREGKRNEKGNNKLLTSLFSATPLSSPPTPHTCTTTYLFP